MKTQEVMNTKRTTKTLLIAVVFACTSVFAPAQPTEDYARKKKVPRTFISAGTHLGLWSLLGAREMPFGIDADYTVFPDDEVTIGLGYTFDNYKQSPLSSENTVRENIRVRALQYELSRSKDYMIYYGGSFGVSFWRKNSFLHDGTSRVDIGTYSAQAILGCRWIPDDFLFITGELALGPPYAIRVGVGINL